MPSIANSLASMTVEQLQKEFLAERSRILAAARFHSRDILCHQRRADYIAEVEALCWSWFLRLIRRGKDPRDFISTLAVFSVRAVRSGRRLCGQLKGKDAMTELAQRRHGFRVERLRASTTECLENLYGAPGGQHRHDRWEECLRDNTLTPVPEQVAFRCDFAAWIESLTDRDRQLISDMSQAERTSDLAQRYRVSPARISQLRREYQEAWNRFCADDGDVA